MTGAELKTFTENVLDGNVDWTDEHFYTLLNIAKTKLEEQRLWQYLKKLDTRAATSSPITLPSDFAEDYKVVVGSREYIPVRFEDHPAYSGASGRYYIDWANLTLNLLGSNISGTLYTCYKRFTPDIATATSPVFPDRFHPLLAYYTAAIHQVGTDNDDLMARMGPANKLAAQELERAMKQWDSAIAIRAQDNQIGVANSVNEISIGNM